MTILTSQLPPNQTLEMPCNNLLTTSFITKDEHELGVSGKIYQTLFVDAVNGIGVVSPDGSIGAPFQTAPAAIAYAVAQGWTAVQLLLAPATYAQTITIPEGLSVSFQGWDTTLDINPAILGGNITITATESTSTISFVNCFITASTISSGNPATQNLEIDFDHCTNSASIHGHDLTLQYQQSAQTGNVVASGSCSIRWDGPSWSYFMQHFPTLPAGVQNFYFDAGHDVYARSLTKNSVAIGATAFVSMTVPNFVLQGDRVQIQVVDPSVQDFICGIHGVGTTGNVTAWITNLSRVSTNFNEAILLLVHHNTMVSEPAP